MALDVSFSPDGSRASLRISHPKGNIITGELIAAFRQALDGLAQNPHLKLVTLTGAGPDFSFGASVPEHAPDRIGEVLPAMHALIDELLQVPAATAAIVRGRCLGGGFELALACDLIFAAEDTTFGLPEIQLGVFPPAAAALLPPRVGYARATSAILTGRNSSSSDWLHAGLLEAVAPAGALDDAVDHWFATHLAPKSASSLRHAAAAARSGLLAHVRHTLPALERLYLDDLMHTADAAEGIEAFIQKRVPRWRDA